MILHRTQNVIERLERAADALWKKESALLRNNAAGLSYLLFSPLGVDSKGHYKYTVLYIKMRNLGNRIQV